MSAAQSLSLTFARIGLGVIAGVHGLANTFGLFGGPGIERFAADMEARMSVGAGLTSTVVAFGELFAGLSLVLGPFARISATLVLVLVCGVCFVSARYTTFWVKDNGIEYLLALAALSVVVMAHGPGAFCLDLGRLLQKLRGKGKGDQK
jgi:putative oxidoreductase